MNDFKKFCIDEKLSPVQIVGARKAWQEQQAIIDNLKAQLNNMEACYIGVKTQAEDQQKRIDEALVCVDQAKDGFYGFSCEGGDTDNLAKHLEKALRGDNA